MVFTGIVQAIGRAVFDTTTNKLHVKAPSSDFWQKCATGDSIAINGCCLTILAETTTDTATFFVMEESRGKTNLVNLATVSEASAVTSALSNSLQSSEVNMERALKVGDPLGGHTVTGHIDGVVAITATHEHQDKSLSVWIQLPPSALVVHKGSVALDGVSLTVAELKEGQLRVSLIPHTQENTTLHLAKPGRLLNIEFDQNLKLLQQQAGISKGPIIEVASMEPYARQQIDEARMARAIELGERGRPTAPVNPWVGCVITDKFGNIIGEGFHAKAGLPHAEIVAIQDAKRKFEQLSNGQGDFAKFLEHSTCYTTLEPCSHFGRTGPCDQALIAHKFGRVVVALVDPDEKVVGTGIDHLKAAGIAVETGILAKEAKESLRAYMHQRVTKRPWVVLKIASSLDAKICARDGSSQWISNEASRVDVHKRWRATSQAILVGSKTAQVDDPSLTTRHWPEMMVHEHAQQPLRVVVGKSVVLGKNLLNTSLSKTVVFTSEEFKTPEDWIEAGVEVVKFPLDSHGHIPFDCVLNNLGARGILQLLVEGGATLASSLIQSALVDQLVVYQAPIILGAGALDWSVAQAPASLSLVKPLTLSKVSTFGSDVCLEYIKST